MADGAVIETQLASPPRNVASMAPAVIEHQGGLVRSAAQLSEVKAAFHEYVALCDELLVVEDYQQIGNKSFRKKSAWRKLAVAYSVSVQIVERIHERDGRMIIRTEVIARATAPNGRFMDGIGACDAFERCCDSKTCKRARFDNHTCCDRLDFLCDGFNHFSKPNHDIPATAATRATNRACADLFGMGEVSAEEVTDDGSHDAQAPPPRTRDRRQGQQPQRGGNRPAENGPSDNDAPPDDRPTSTTQQAPGLPNGWADQAACDSAHKTVGEQIRQALLSITDEGQRAEARKPFDEHRTKYGWPMIPDALTALSVMVAKAHVPSPAPPEPPAPESASDGQIASAAPVAQPEPPPAPVAPEAAGSLEPAGASPKVVNCPWCETPLLAPDPAEQKMLVSHKDDAGNSVSWHKICRDEWAGNPAAGLPTK